MRSSWNQGLKLVSLSPTFPPPHTGTTTGASQDKKGWIPTSLPPPSTSPHHPAVQSQLPLFPNHFGLAIWIGLVWLVLGNSTSFHTFGTTKVVDSFFAGYVLVQFGVVQNRFGMAPRPPLSFEWWKATEPKCILDHFTISQRKMYEDIAASAATGFPLQKLASVYNWHMVLF